MKKKLVFFLLICVVSVTLLSACASAELTEEEVATYTDDVGLSYTLYKVTSHGEESYYVKVTAYTGKERLNLNDDTFSGVVTVPSKVTIEGAEYPVTVIGSLVFNQKMLTRIVVEEGITTLEPFSFSYCGCSRIVLPSTITSIGDYAFVNCNSLKRLEISAVTPPQVGSYAFMFFNKDKNVYEVNSILIVKVPTVGGDKTVVNAYKEAWKEYEGIIE